MRYLLGDSDIAARRLKLVAEIFAPSTKAFLNETNLSRPELVLDLGCGPGHTTRLLANNFKGSATVGIDGSEKFIREAVSSGKATGASFVCHDVSKVPFPAGPADLIFSRYLLLHLENPLEVVKKWITQLKIGGLLLLEELEQIQTAELLFEKYLNLMDRSLATQNKTMFIGSRIAAHEFEGAKFKMKRIREIEVSASDAANMFYMNMLTLQKSPYVRALYSDQEIEKLAADLARMAGNKTPAATVMWRLRQVVLQRK